MSPWFRAVEGPPEGPTYVRVTDADRGGTKAVFFASSVAAAPGGAPAWAAAAPCGDARAVGDSSAGARTGGRMARSLPSIEGG